MKKIISVFILLVAIFPVTTFLLSSCTDEETAIYEAVITHHYDGDSYWHVGKVLSISGSDEYANALSPGELFEFCVKNYNGERLNEGDRITFTNVTRIIYDGIITQNFGHRYKVEIINVSRNQAPKQS